MKSVLSLVLSLVLLAGCGDPVSQGSKARILAMGDSLMATHQVAGLSIADRVAQFLGEPVIDRSVIGAHVIYNLPISGSMGLNISKQFVPGNWEWVVLNGGGNDLWLGCGCVRCDGRMAKLVSPGGESGQIPALIAQLRATGAKVIYVGYLRSPGVASPIDHCRGAGDELERRIASYAATDPGVHFLSLRDLVPAGDRSFHAFDMIHPSHKASAAIGQRIAAIISRN